MTWGKFLPFLNFGLPIYKMMELGLLDLRRPFQSYDLMIHVCVWVIVGGEESTGCPSYYIPLLESHEVCSIKDSEKS